MLSVWYDEYFFQKHLINLRLEERNGHFLNVVNYFIILNSGRRVESFILYINSSLSYLVHLLMALNTHTFLISRKYELKERRKKFQNFKPLNL
jgi:hypothetical protein